MGEKAAGAGRVTNGARVRPVELRLRYGLLWFSPSVPNAAMQHRNSGPLGSAPPTVRTWRHVVDLTAHPFHPQVLK